MTIWQRISGLATVFGDSHAPVRAIDSPARVSGRDTVAFTIAVIALGAKMAKADGVVSPVEVDAFHQVFKTAPDQADHVTQVFELAQRDIAGYEAYASQVRDLLSGEEHLLRNVLESLFYIASADRALHPAEDRFLKTVADRFGLAENVFRHVRAQFVADDGAPYDVLGLDPSATDAEVKVRYRKLVRENHPDLLSGRGLPAEIVAVANHKLAAINAAYAALASERGL